MNADLTASADLTVRSNLVVPSRGVASPLGRHNWTYVWESNNGSLNWPATTGGSTLVSATAPLTGLDTAPLTNLEDLTNAALRPQGNAGFTASDVAWPGGSAPWATRILYCPEEVPPDPAADTVWRFLSGANFVGGLQFATATYRANWSSVSFLDAPISIGWTLIEQGVSAGNRVLYINGVDHSSGSAPNHFATGQFSLMGDQNGNGMQSNILWFGARHGTPVSFEDHLQDVQDLGLAA